MLERSELSLQQIPLWVEDSWRVQVYHVHLCNVTNNYMPTHEHAVHSRESWVRNQPRVVLLRVVLGVVELFALTLLIALYMYIHRPLQTSQVQTLNDRRVK